tara:strand:+ start:235 stop:435 length:201 start_codon:yes stop_codon:yes gene_type:complete
MRSGRRARGVDKGSAYRRQQQKDIEQNAYVDALGLLFNAGFRMLELFGCVDNSAIAIVKGECKGNK